MFDQLKELAVDAIVLVGTWFFVTFCGMMGQHNGFFTCGKAPQVETTKSP